MTSQAPSYHGYRFPPEIISQAVWLYHRFCLSFRDAEDLLAPRGITVTYETIRRWCRTFSPAYARTLRHRRGQMSDTWYLNEVFVNIRGRQQYLWGAVDEDGDVIDILVQSRLNRAGGQPLPDLCPPAWGDHLRVGVPQLGRGRGWRRRSRHTRADDLVDQKYISE